MTFHLTICRRSVGSQRILLQNIYIEIQIFSSSLLVGWSTTYTHTQTHTILITMKSSGSWCLVAALAIMSQSVSATLFGLGKDTSSVVKLPPAREISREHIQEVPVIKEVPIIKEIIKEVPQVVVKKVPIDRIVYVDRPYETYKERIVDKIVPIDRPVEIIKEIPVEKVRIIWLVK